MAEKKKVRILSLDGGGIRGVIPATIVEYIEEQIKTKKKDPNARVADYFDLIIGTSTGGLLTCFYLKPNLEPGEGKPSTAFPASKALEVYTEEGYDIFNKSKYFAWFGLRQLWNATQYNPSYLEGALQKYFKEEDGTTDMMLNRMVKPCTVTTYNMNTKNSMFLRSTDSDRKDDPRDYKVWEALRSTSAAPTYFPPAVIHNYAKPVTPLNKLYNLDGGVFANNPTICAYAEARNMEFPERGVNRPSAEDMLILSVGTGGGNFALEPLQTSNRWSVIKWAKSIPNIMMDGSIDTTDYQLRQIYQTLNEKHHNSYLRVDVQKEDREMYSADMADAAPENIANLKKAGKKTVDAFKKQLDNFIDRIIEE
ncbi:MAG: patatin-like phospholipase family protein [Crocinitomicaceae bacterium]